MKLLPVALQLQNAPVLIVGGGVVAARKARALQEVGALMTVISPELCADFPSPVEYIARFYREGDCIGFKLVFAATDSINTNSQILTEAQGLGIWVNDVSGPQDSNFHTSAVVRRGEIAIGISTGGLSPVLSKHLKLRMEDTIGEEYAILLQMVHELGVPDLSTRGDFWRAILASPILDLLRAGTIEGAHTIIKEIKERYLP